MALFTNDAQAYRDWVATHPGREDEATLVGYSGAPEDLPDDWTYENEGLANYEAWQMEQQMPGGEPLRPPVVNSESFTGVGGHTYLIEYYEGGSSETFLLNVVGDVETRTSVEFKTPAQNPGFEVVGSPWVPAADGSFPGLTDGSWTSQSAFAAAGAPAGGDAPAGDGGGATSTELRSATDILRDTLSTYGLEGLLDDPNLDLINLWITTGDDDAVWAQVRQSEPYKTRFPGMADLSAAGRAISEADYVALERSYAQTLQAYDMPERFYDDPSDFGALIGGDVSTTEFTQRVATAFEVIGQTTSEVRQALSDYYGITDSDLAAYYLDPEKATSIFEEREKLGAARIGGIAVETGFGSVSQQTAERLRASGVTETAARRGFQTIAPSTLAEETASESLDRDPVTGRPMASLAVVGQQKPGNITPEELVGGEFGTDPQAAKRIEARRQRRLAAFAQRGGPAMTGGGYTGLGTAT